MKLLLIRHGKAESKERPDFQRRLTDRGRGQAQFIGEQLRSLKLSPNLILCSDAARTQETLDELKLDPKREKTLLSHEIYSASDPVPLIQVMDGLLQSHKNVEMVAVIGHNPTISLLSEYLTGQMMDFSTGEGQLLQYDGSEWEVGLRMEGEWRQVCLLTPKEL